MNTLILVFTDLDGTFLDHNSYDFTPALPCLDLIRKNNIPLIFTSSKTAIEIENISKETDCYHPYIAENGGLLAIPNNYFPRANSKKQNYKKKLIGKSRTDINSILNDLSKTFLFKSFKEMTIKEITSATGLKEELADHANMRDCSEPLTWLDTDEQLTKFIQQLEKFGLQLIRGGRFHHVMGQHDKATTMSHLIKLYEQHLEKQIISIALGDSPNDFQMIYKADYGVIIPNPNAPNQCQNIIENKGNILYADNPGPTGWNQALSKLLKELLND